MRTRVIAAVLALGPISALAAGCGDTRPAADAGAPLDCSLRAELEARPGFPFDPQVFRKEVWPVLADSCALAGCHLAPSGTGNFEIWPVSPAPEAPCDFARSFNAVYEKTDFRNDPRNSRVHASVTGSNPAHPALEDSPDLDVILDYVSAAHVAYVDHFGEIDPSQLFDLETYAGTIQPSFESAGCLTAGCHHPDTAAGGFALWPQPEPDSPELEQSFRATIKLVDFSTGQDGAPLSRIYVRSIDSHRGPRLSDGEAEALLAWIRDGLPPGNEPPPPGCASPDTFHLDIFGEEIMPLLRGDRDLNDRDSGRNTTGCTRGPCHGQDRGPGTLYLPEDAPHEDNLRRFACFVDRANPSASQILVCPLDLASCAINPHPGDDIFSGVKDRNYQRILSYLYASASESTPLDFAFFARKINTIFNDPNAVKGGVLGYTCSNNQVCHGVQIVGDNPANLSNLALIPDATLEEDVTLNFIAASNFTYFPEPAQSSLFLYPTNEIANLDNPLATGLPHPSGKNFEPDDPEALLILEWAGGLRTDDQGHLRHWLVAGDFPASNLTDEKIPDEATITPRIFEPSGQTSIFHRGEWNSFFAEEPFIDLNDTRQGFPRDMPMDRIAYAVAYLINTSPNEITAVITVRSPNDVMIFAGDAPPSQGRDGAGASITAPLPAYADTREVTRIMVKVFQRSDDPEFGFDLQFADHLGNLLTGSSRELVFKLGPEGGI